MTILSTKLTKREVDKITEPGYYRDNELAGFCLRVSLNKGKLLKTYLVNTKVKGTRENVSITLGRHGLITAEKARELAKDNLELLRKGINPKKADQSRKEQEQLAEAQRQAELERQRKEAEKQEKAEQDKRNLTLRGVLATYISIKNLKPKTAKDYDLFVKRCLSDWLDLPMAEITADMVEARHKAISKDHPAQANLTMRILRALFTFAANRNESIITTNPVKRISQEKTWNKVKRRQTVVKAHEFKAWYGAVNSLSNKTHRDFLLLAVFTGLRFNEAASLRWCDVDLVAGTLKVEDTKNHETHMLPLSTYLKAMLQKRFDTRTCQKQVFPGPGRHGYLADPRDAVSRVADLSGVDFTVHDLRRTFETIAESCDIAHYTLKRLLNHKMSGDVTSGYIIVDAERLRGAMQSITDRLLELAEVPPLPAAVEDTSRVVPLKRVAR